MPKKPIPTNREDKAQPKFDWFLLLHCGIGLILFALYKISWISLTAMIGLIGGYLLLLNFAFCFGVAKQLQNLLIYLQWLIVAIAQYVIFIIVSRNPNLNPIDIRGITALKGLIVFLIVYQIFRQFSLRYNHKEFEPRGRDSNTILDFMGFFVLFFTTLIIMIYQLQ